MAFKNFEGSVVDKNERMIQKFIDDRKKIDSVFEKDPHLNNKNDK